MNKEQIVPGDTFYNMLLNDELKNKKISIKTGDFEDFIVYIDNKQRVYINLFGKEKDLNTYDLLNSTFLIEEQQDIDYWEEISNAFREYSDKLIERFDEISKLLKKTK